MKPYFRTISLYFLLFLTAKTLTLPIEIYFSPDDRPAIHLIKEIDQTTDRIFAAIYYLSDQKIADALIRAHERKVNVRIISDEQTSKSIYSKMKQLKAYGLSVFVPQEPQSKGFYRTRLMHHKFALVNGKVWIGSYNWTVGANIFNFEDALLITDSPMYDIFLKRYLDLEKKCVPFIPPALATKETLELSILKPLIPEHFQQPQVSQPAA